MLLRPTCMASGRPPDGGGRLTVACTGGGRPCAVGGCRERVDAQLPWCGTKRSCWRVGATGGQYQDALIARVRALPWMAPSVALDPEAPGFLMCRVETTFDGVIIAYSLRVEYHEPLGAGGAPAITWFKSWLGTYGMQQVHLMFGLGELCAEAFEEDWNLAN